MSLLHTNLDIQVVSLGLHPSRINGSYGALSWLLVAGEYNVLIHMDRSRHESDSMFDVETYRSGSSENDVRFSSSSWPSSSLESALSPFVLNPLALPLDIALLRDHAMRWDRKIKAYLRWALASSDDALGNTVALQDRYYEQARADLIAMGLR